MPRKAAVTIHDRLYSISVCPQVRPVQSFCSLKGMVDAGMEIPHGDDIPPMSESKETISMIKSQRVLNPLARK